MLTLPKFTAKLRAAPNKTNTYPYILIEINSFLILKIANINRNSNVKKQIPELQFHTHIAAHFPSSYSARFAYDLPTPAGPATVTTKATIYKILFKYK